VGITINLRRSSRVVLVVVVVQVVVMREWLDGGTVEILWGYWISKGPFLLSCVVCDGTCSLLDTSDVELNPIYGVTLLSCL
jgi:hypothetical protein